jgi:hypothetical protein
VNKNNYLYLLVLFLALLALILMGRSIYGKITIPTPTALHFPTSFVSKEEDQVFASVVAKEVDLNSGITIERATSVNPNQNSDVTFTVFNHTDEDIVFSNQGFGIVIYAYEEPTRRWIPLSLTHPPYSQAQTVPARLEKWGAGIKIWVVLESEIANRGYKQLRLYVSGNGVVTHKIYGAYLDVTTG